MQLRRRTIPIALLAMAGFVVVTTEFIIIGFLPQLAADFGVSLQQAGMLVSLFAFTVACAGPIVTPRLRHLDRRRLFVSIVLMFAVANAAAAVAQSMWVFALARFLPAVALPVFWGLASDTAVRSGGPGREARSVAGIYLGMSTAMVIGVPLGTVAAASIGWRGCFAALAVAALIMAVCLHFGMTTASVGGVEEADARGYALLRAPMFLVHVALSILVFTAMFAAYTFLAEILGVVVGVDAARVGWWLMAFGIVGLFGNWVGGWLADRLPIGSSIVFAVLLAVGMAAVAPLSSVQAGVMGALFIWGSAFTGLFPISQIRVMAQARGDRSLAATVNVSAANAGAGLGALVGGVTIDLWGIQSLGFVAAAIALVATLCVLVVAICQRRPARSAGMAPSGGVPA
ncbi:MFS transporter [Mycolicibacterium wolinskyi]|uniref:MFS transporter n=2 Tax=Mycolicibacterium wolinskyi TaxID=59750 RepID=A0A1X2F1V5_9MYCO|nr:MULTISPECIES: MFS transporter [Mycolicibacterium]MCV7287850.1 MFS transporter [Mycolicibacterium wolinskyi]MCV7294748.1 MFS transporter [Mycolicibacterium goodii]ORX12397.1 MFS transporter [Mycolicibacterium wolinskyi]